jgi:hypothetical protein
MGGHEHIPDFALQRGAGHNIILGRGSLINGFKRIYATVSKAICEWNKRIERAENGSGAERNPRDRVNCILKE